VIRREHPDARIPPDITPGFGPGLRPTPKPAPRPVRGNPRARRITAWGGPPRGLPSEIVTEILIASDSRSLIDELTSVLGEPDTTIRSVDNGAMVRDAVGDLEPDLVVLDLQIGNMGGMAVALDLAMEAEAGRLPEVPVLLLLDRSADIFLARHSNVEGWLVKPLDALRLGRAARALMAGERFEEGSIASIGPVV